MRYCNTPDTYWNNVLIIEKLLFHGHWTTNNCTHCRRQCHQDIYVAYTEMTKMKSNDRNESKVSKLRLFYQVNSELVIVSGVNVRLIYFFRTLPLTR